MFLFKLAYRNFFRNTRRSIISGISVAIAIAVIIFAKSYLKGATENISGNIIKLISGHIRITTREYERRERLIPLSEAIELTPEFHKAVQDEEILQVTSRIKFGVLLGEEGVNVPAMGYAVEPEKEIGITGLDRRIIEGTYITADENAAIIGRGLAERLKVKIGDTLTVITRTAFGSPSGINILVKGIFSTGIGGIDRSLFYIPLSVGQKLLDLDQQATEIVIVLKDPTRALVIASKIRSRLDYSVVPFQYNPLLRYLNAADIIYSFYYFIILLVACSAIANTMLMVVFERTKEIGTMKAMGLNNISIVGLLTIEAGIIGVAGSFLGAVVGGLLSYWLSYQGIDLSIMSSSTSADMPFGPIIYLSPTPFILVGGFLFGLIITIIVSLLPISRVTKLEPAQSLRTV